jgi:uncharacterized low-complexity protein
MLILWQSAVWMLMPSRSAIALSANPSTRRRHTSASRTESGICGEAKAAADMLRTQTSPCGNYYIGTGPAPLVVRRSTRKSHLQVDSVENSNASPTPVAHGSCNDSASRVSPAWTHGHLGLVRRDQNSQGQSETRRPRQVRPCRSKRLGLVRDGSSPEIAPA